MGAAEAADPDPQGECQLGPRDLEVTGRGGRHADVVPGGRNVGVPLAAPAELRGLAAGRSAESLSCGPPGTGLACGSGAACLAGGVTTGADAGGVMGVAGVAGRADGPEPGLPFDFAGGTSLGDLPLPGSACSASSGSSALPGACTAWGSGAAVS